MSKIMRFILEIEDVEDEDFAITDSEAREVLSDLEETIGKKHYAINRVDFEREDF